MQASICSTVHSLCSNYRLTSMVINPNTLAAQVTGVPASVFGTLLMHAIITTAGGEKADEQVADKIVQVTRPVL